MFLDFVICSTSYVSLITTTTTTTTRIHIQCSHIMLNKWWYNCKSQSQWPRGLRRRSAAARLLRLWIRILPEAWMIVCCEWCVLSGRGLCDELITRPEESYRIWCVVMCDLETLRMRRPWPVLGCSAIGRGKKKSKNCNMNTHRGIAQIYFLSDWKGTSE